MNKSFLTLLLIISISCSSDDRIKKIIGEWKIINVVRLDINEALPDQEVMISFNSDRTWNFKSDMFGNEGSGKWDFERNNLMLISTTDTIICEIEKFTESEIVWISNLGESGLRFELEKE